MWIAGRGAMGKKEKETMVQSRKKDERKQSTTYCVKLAGTRPSGRPLKRWKDSWQSTSKKILQKRVQN